jgi:hypothetical protein
MFDGTARPLVSLMGLAGIIEFLGVRLSNRCCGHRTSCCAHNVSRVSGRWPRGRPRWQSLQRHSR